MNRRGRREAPGPARSGSPPSTALTATMQVRANQLVCLTAATLLSARRAGASPPAPRWLGTSESGSRPRRSASTAVQVNDARILWPKWADEPSCRRQNQTATRPAVQPRCTRTPARRPVRGSELPREGRPFRTIGQDVERASTTRSSRPSTPGRGVSERPCGGGRPTRSDGLALLRPGEHRRHGELAS